MTLPRSELIDLSQTPYYHCMTRCVRRTYLCGVDQETGQDFSHRKTWLQNRILHLSTIFAIKICAYAIMSNHYHLVLFIDESQAKAWDPKDVIERWKLLFPKNAKEVLSRNLPDTTLNQKIEQWREHLMNLSWYMRCLNEPIARSSNEEDNCTGRFWEGRYKSKAILDDGALLTTMAYVDLNPIRAGSSTTLESSEFTSIFERIKTIIREKSKNSSQSIDDLKQPDRLSPFINNKKQKDISEHYINFKLSDYLTLVDETGRIIRSDKKGTISENLAPVLTRLNLTSRGWLDMMKWLDQGYYYAIGNESQIISFSAKFSKRSPKGLKTAKLCYLKIA